MEGGISEKERLAFIRKSYFLAAICIIATSVKTFLTVTLGVLHDAVIKNLHLAYMGLVLFFVCSIVLFTVPLKSPYNIIVAILLVESLTVAVVTISALCTPTLVLGAYATAITAAIFVSLFSVFIAGDITKFVNLLVLGVLINCVFCITMVIVILIYWQKVFTLILVTWQLFTLLIYHTQVICGNKFGVIETYGTNGASLIIYIDVTIAYILILTLYERLLWNDQSS